VKARRKREGEREREYVCTWERKRVGECVRERVRKGESESAKGRKRVRERVCVYVYACGKERKACARKRE